MAMAAIYTVMEFATAVKPAARQLAAATERRRQADQAALQRLRIIRWSRAPRRIYSRLRSLTR